MGIISSQFSVLSSRFSVLGFGFGSRFSVLVSFRLLFKDASRLGRMPLLLGRGAEPFG